MRDFRMRYTGYVPIVSLLVMSGLGALIAESAGIPDWVGGLVGAIIGFLASRAVLRYLYDRTPS